jgi:hypothetical protein
MIRETTLDLIYNLFSRAHEYRAARRAGKCHRFAEDYHLRSTVDVRTLILKMEYKLSLGCLISGSSNSKPSILERSNGAYTSNLLICQQQALPNYKTSR